MPQTPTLARRATSSDPTTQLYRKGTQMPSHIVLPDDPRYHEDLEAELADERYDRALKRITVSDVLATVDDMVQSEPDMRRHPLHALARHCLRNGTYRTSGQRAHMSDHLAAVFEDLIGLAIEKLVAEELASGVSWED
jgi:hypothetical protein